MTIVFVIAAVLRRDALRSDALTTWSARSSFIARLASTTASGWLLSREGDARLLANAASRTPQLFGVRPAIGETAISPDTLAKVLTQSLASINQLHPYNAIWLFDRNGAVRGTTANGSPPVAARRAANQALATDSAIAFGPFVKAGDTVGIAFAQRVVVTVADPASRTPSRAVIGAIVLTAKASPLLNEMAAWSEHSATETSSLVVAMPDSVFEFALTPERIRGERRGAWARGAAPALALSGFAPQSDTAARADGDQVAFGMQLGDLPWELTRREASASVFAGVNGRLSTEASTAAAVLFMIAIVVIGRRQTARERKLIEVAESEVRYRLLADNATDVIARHAPDGRILYISPAVQAILGYHPRQLRGRYPSEFFHEEDATTMDDILAALRVTTGASRAEHRLRHANGEYVWVETTGRAVRDPVWGQVTELVTVSREIEDRKKAEAALRASEADYRILFEMNPQPMWAFDADTYRFVAVNDEAVAHYGYSREEFMGMTILDIRPPGEMDGARERVANFRNGLTNMHGVTHRRKDGTLMTVDLTVHEVQLRGRMTRLVLVKDVTETMRTASALRESNELIRALFDSSPVAIIATDLAFRVLQWNGAAERLFGWTAAEVVGGLYPLATEAMLPEVQRIRERVLRDGTFNDVHAMRIRKDGSTVEVSLSVGVIRNAAGQPGGYVLLAADVSERTKLETQLRQAQKMDAVGQLAGGIAHDFNNLLTVVTGYAGILLYDLETDSPIRPDIEEIVAAADRAGLLTRQLLAFSRQQLLQPKVLDLNEVISGMEEMLRRVLPSTINFVTDFGSSLGAVNADPGQIEQVLMNLIVNARDAMTEGGTLTVATRDVTLSDSDGEERDVAPGEYVMISVEDTGHGIPHNLENRIFEPFFTTKSRGEGTGLGLSTAHGIVTQSAGCISVQSTPGTGTTFTVCLPRVRIESEVVRKTLGIVTATPKAASTGSVGDPDRVEAVLLVEDDPLVRLTTMRVLQRAGYKVVPASNGREALEIHAAYRADNSRIDLVVSDMVMPEMSGREMIRLVREREPGIAVLLMSGYSEQTSHAGDLVDATIDFVQKPFTTAALTEKVRLALDRARTGAGSGARSGAGA